MRMGYNMMNVMRLGIEFSPSARLQGFRCAPPPACGLQPLTGLGNVIAHRMRGFHRLPVYRGFAALHRLPVVCSPLRGLTDERTSIFGKNSSPKNKLLSDFFVFLHRHCGFF